jgi:hypothetical protein
MGVEADKARELLAALKDIPLAGFDRSFKMTEKLLLGHRFLLGVRKEQIDVDKLWGICAGMGMPGEYAEAFAKGLPAANTVHFGFEENENGCVYKVYLEFWARLNEHTRSNATGGALLHLAFKWDALDDRKRAVTRYVCHPHLSVADILARMAGTYAGHADQTSCEIAQEIVKLAAPRFANGAPMYLEVCEADNPRLSFDINLHQANLKLQDVHHLLSRMARHYAIPSDPFEEFYSRIEDSALGHISAGIDRHGRDFLTTYYE